MFVVEPEAIDNVLAEDEFWDIKLNDALFSDVHFDKFGVSWSWGANLAHGFEFFFGVWNLEWKVPECNDDFFLFEQELMIEFGTIPEIKKVEESFSEGNEETFEGAIGLM